MPDIGTLLQKFSLKQAVTGSIEKMSILDLYQVVDTVARAQWSLIPEPWGFTWFKNMFQKAMDKHILKENVTECAFCL